MPLHSESLLRELQGCGLEQLRWITTGSPSAPGRYPFSAVWSACQYYICVLVRAILNSCAMVHCPWARSILWMRLYSDLLLVDGQSRCIPLISPLPSTWSPKAFLMQTFLNGKASSIKSSTFCSLWLISNYKNAQFLLCALHVTWRYWSYAWVTRSERPEGARRTKLGLGSHLDF